MAIAYADDKLVRGSEILHVYEELGWALLASRDPTDVEASVRNASVFLTARDGAKLVGFVSVISDHAYYAHITELAVRDRHRERGVQAELLRRALDEVGVARVVTIFSDPDDQSVLQGLGFATTGGGLLLRRE